MPGMPKLNDEEAQLLEVLRLIEAHRHGAMNAAELQQAIGRVRNPSRLLEARLLWKVAAVLLAAAIVAYAMV